MVKRRYSVTQGAISSNGTKLVAVLFVMIVSIETSTLRLHGEFTTLGALKSKSKKPDYTNTIPHTLGRISWLANET